ncbi:MBL fold metallo-hydrolase [Chenggangzhangella methanolivorans]|uniref:MBL fold metallo-hydrolase n=1 Tax=Chenggangzhangella methanolivorans TaxID=1437009 RepID=UPI0021BDB39A|nr:MBL fold metallo-hydrolase [Chenggangzhangella methanolivorans]
MPQDLLTRARPGAAAAVAALCASLVAGAPAEAAPAVEPLPTTEIAPGVFVYQAPFQLLAPGNQGAIANVGFVVGREGVAVIDTGNTPEAGARLLAAVKARTDLPVRYVVNTHMHPDHALGDSAFRATGAKFVAHAKFARALTARAQSYVDAAKRQAGDALAPTLDDIVKPDIEVADRLTLDLGGRALEFEAEPTAHTDNDLTVRDVQTDTWFLGDLLFMTHLPSVDGSFEGWVKLMARLRERKAAGWCRATVPCPPDGRRRSSRSSDTSTGSGPTSRRCSTRGWTWRRRRGPRDCPNGRPGRCSTNSTPATQ